jgi:hypothetical protein
VFSNISLQHQTQPRKSLADTTTNFRVTPCWLSAFYIITIIAAVALEVLR